MKIHHDSCWRDKAWDIENVPCCCPKYWPRKKRKSVVKIMEKQQMKTTQKQPKKAHGAYVATAVRSLRRSGLSGQVLQTAIDAISGHSKIEIIKLPRKVSKSICEQLSTHTRVVVVNKGPKRFKVYSLDGYLASQAHSSRLAKKNKPWTYATRNNSEKVELKSVVHVQDPVVA